jgi:hypothetical protein
MSRFRIPLLTRIWPPIKAQPRPLPAPGDIVEMQSAKHGAYFGTVLAVRELTCEVKVEFLHPTTREYWRGWRGYDEITVIQKANVA